MPFVELSFIDDAAGRQQSDDGVQAVRTCLKISHSGTKICSNKDTLIFYFNAIIFVKLSQTFTCLDKLKLETLVNATMKNSMCNKSFKALVRQLSQLVIAIQCADVILDNSNKRSKDVLQTIKKIALLLRAIENYIATNEKWDNCQKCMPKAEANQYGSCLQSTYCSRKCQQKH